MHTVKIGLLAMALAFSPTMAVAQAQRELTCRA
jgi:hypothetical protein